MRNLLILLPPYLLGFCPLLAVKTWKSFSVAAALGVAAIVAANILALMSGGYAVLALVPLAAIFSTGVITGFATSGVLIGTSIPKQSVIGAIVIAIGLASAPFALSLYRQYSLWQSRSAYAELPTVKDIKPLVTCERFWMSGSLLDKLVVVENPLGVKSDVHVRYPVDYLAEEKPSFPRPMQQVSGPNFAMHIDNSSPIRSEESKNAEGFLLPRDKRKPFVEFRLETRKPVEDVSLARLTSRFSLEVSSGDLAELTLAPSTVERLQIVMNEPPSYLRDEEVLLEINQGNVSAMLQCKLPGSVPQPHCRFIFDDNEFKIAGTYLTRDLAEWPKIRSDITDFFKCIRITAVPNF